jgi:ArsR family transcriptional regulator
MDDIYVLHADICKTLANPKRLEIINTLRDEELTASQLLMKINISKANLSQHMSILIQKGVVRAHRKGKNVFYRLSDNRIIKACDLMREVLIKNLEQNSKVLERLKE